MFPLTDTSSCSPLPSSGSRGISASVPRSHRYYRFVRLLHILHASSPVSLDWRYSSPPRRWREMQRSFPSSWGILVNTCPGLGTPVAPLDLALSVQQILPTAGLTASASTTTKDFGADSSRPMFSLSTLRTQPVTRLNGKTRCWAASSGFAQVGLSPTRFH